MQNIHVFNTLPQTGICPPISLQATPKEGNLSGWFFYFIVF